MGEEPFFVERRKMRRSGIAKPESGTRKPLIRKFKRINNPSQRQFSFSAIYAVRASPFLLALLVLFVAPFAKFALFPFLGYKNQNCFYSKSGIHINLIQPFYDGGEDVIRHFEVNGVRSANSRLFRSSCFPHTRIFKEILQYAKPDIVNIVANADILFDRSILVMVQNMTKSIVYALSRHEADGYFIDRPDSQDAWVFYGNDIHKKMDTGLLTIGKPGFDNRIAYEMYKVGYRVLNPSRSIRVWHIHASQERSYSAEEAIPPPYYAVNPTYLDEIYHENNNINESSVTSHGSPFKYVWDHQGNFKIEFLTD